MPNYQDEPVFVNGLTFVADLRSMIERIENPDLALLEIEELFTVMEMEVFRNNGAAPSFGHFETWRPLAASTIKSGNLYGTPLIRFGFLQDSATNPKATYFSHRVNLSIDPRNTGAGGSYSKGKNYGFFHQYGIGRNPERQVIPDPLPPLFLAAIYKIIDSYITEDLYTEPQHEDPQVKILEEKAKGRVPRKAKKELKKAGREPVNERKPIDQVPQKQEVQNQHHAEPPSTSDHSKNYHTSEPQITPTPHRAGNPVVPEIQINGSAEGFKLPEINNANSFGQNFMQKFATKTAGVLSKAKSFAGSKIRGFLGR
jgi:hypothetical protein